jgi:hypothetical protein
MGSWDSAAAGTRLWQKTILAQVIFTVVMVVLIIVATFRIMSRSGGLGMNPARVESQLITYTMVMAGIGLVFQGLLIVVGNHWCKGPQLPSAMSKAKTYRTMAIIALALNVLSLGINVTGSEAPWVMNLAAGILALVMIFTALSLQSDYLAGLESQHFHRSEKLRSTLGMLLVSGFALAILGRLLGMLGALMMLAWVICFIVWFVYFVIFLGQAAAEYENGGALDADVFD